MFEYPSERIKEYERIVKIQFKIDGGERLSSYFSELLDNLWTHMNEHERAYIEGKYGIGRDAKQTNFQVQCV